MKQIIKILVLLLIIISCDTDNEKVEQLTYKYSELVHKSTKELRLIRNEIFAKHGYIFLSKDLKDHFSKMEWYNPKYKEVDFLLTELDKTNIQTILKAEKYIDENEHIKVLLSSKPNKSIVNFDLPFTLEYIISVIGKPDFVIIDKSEFCSVGQIHFWKFKTQNIELIVLGDKYYEPIDYYANSRLVVIKSLNAENQSDFDGIFGINLGNTQLTVENKIKQFVKINDTYWYEKLENQTIVDRYFTAKYKSTYWVTDGSVFFHLVINKYDRLEYIIQSSFNVRTAC